MSERRNEIAEASILGALMIKNDLFDELSDILGPEDFYVPTHSELWTCISGMFSEGKIVDPITVNAEFPEFRLKYLADCVSETYSTSAALPYAKEVRKLAKQRQVDDVLNEQLLSNDDPDERISKIQSLTLPQHSTSSIGPVMVGEDIGNAIEKLAIAKNAGVENAGLSTGLPDIDRMTGGLHKGELTVIAGRPSKGKTALACQIGLHSAMRGKGVLFFSLEMRKEQVAHRQLSSLSSVNGTLLRRPAELSDEDIDKLSVAGEKIRTIPLWIDDDPTISVERMATRAKRLNRQFGIDLIMVDYLQRMRVKGKGTLSQELGHMAMEILNIGIAIDVPVILLSQLNRSADMMHPKEGPLLGHLRESGDIEAHANVVWMLWHQDEDNPNSVNLKIPKNRDGPTTNNMTLGFDTDTLLFHNVVNLDRDIAF